MWCWLTSFTVDEITSIIQSAAVLVVAIPAFRGLNSWRVQLLGKKKIELAEEALVLAYELQAAIEWARHPVSYGGEGQERPNRDQETDAIRNTNDSYYSRVSRLNESMEQFSRLRALQMLFRAHFANEAQEALSTFFITRNRINSAVGMLINHAGERDYPVGLRQADQEIIWDHSTQDQPDETRRTINDAVSEIERVCRPILSKP